PDEIRYLLKLAANLKDKKRAGIRGKTLEGKNIVLLFEKASTRTRCSFEVAAKDEGADVTYLTPSMCHMRKKESWADTGAVLGHYYDGIEYRGFEQSTVETLAANAGVPVWNGLTDVDHPTQILADLLTIQEHLNKPLDEVKVAFCGDTRNNMAYAWMYGCAKLGMHFVGWGPKALRPAADVIAYCEELSKDTGAVIEFGEDISLLKGADVIYTDIWVSMGEEAKVAERVKLLTPFKVTQRVMAAAENPKCLFMHCLPAYHDFETLTAQHCMEEGYDIREVEDEVFKSKNSVVIDEAENRMHTIKAVMVATLGDI
ncbi:MAG: ornithine carbamoyltransferase, partial [Oscillospiraceae bacterium]|nr:ornithine carbamoyltransferase [Oscillospiraceae bacterium]